MPELLKPPAIPTAILNFFASQPHYPAVAGDISEEFHQRVLTSGANAARRWYWREAIRNAWALTCREILQTPARTTLVAVSCFLAVELVTAWFVIRALPSRRNPWDVFATQLLFLFAAGLTGGKFLPRREWALALTFTALSITIAGGVRWYFPIHFSASQLVAVALRSAPRQGVFWLGCLWIRLIHVHSRSFAAISITPGTPRSSAPRNPPDPY